jgi:ferredoxin/flavodoxin---NADP+ reductase
MNTNSQTDSIVDITILGGGPTGLAAAYYAGHRDATVRLVESLEQLGGQVAALYPEKAIFDVAGCPKVGGQELIERLCEQGLQYNPDVILGETIETLTRREDGILEMRTSAGRVLLSRTLVVTAGHGAFEPRRLGLPELEAFEGKGVRYAVREKSVLKGKRLAVIGGGDSALDWTMNLQDTIVPPVYLIHRREEFRGLESSVNECRRLAAEGRVKILTPAQVRGAEGDAAGRLRAITVENTATNATERFEVDEVLLTLGFISHLGPIADWGLEFVNKKQVKVNSKMETNLPGVYAAGDIAGYDGKITLITVGFSEAAIAANHAVSFIRGEKAQPAYSSQ